MKTLIAFALTMQFLASAAQARTVTYVSESYPASKSASARLILNSQDTPIMLALGYYEGADRFVFVHFDQVVSIQKTEPVTFMTAHGSRFQLSGNSLSIESEGPPIGFRFLKSDSGSTDALGAGCPTPRPCH